MHRWITLGLFLVFLAGYGVQKYAAAAQSLLTPSSAARAVAAGAPNIERTDKLVKLIGAQKGMHSPVVDEIVATVDARLEANRKK